MAIMSES